MIEGLASIAAEVAETSGNVGSLDKVNFDTSEPQDFSGTDINSNNDFSGEMDLSGDDSGVTSSDVLDTSQEMDYSGDDNSGDFASEKDGNKESEGQIKENTVAEENKPKETTEQSEPEKEDKNIDTSDDNLTDEENNMRDSQVDNSGEKNETEKYGKDSLDNLEHTENFADGAIGHIFEGAINSKGDAVGYHSESVEDTRGSVVEGTESAPDKNGVYKAEVEVDGVKKQTNGGESSFFPRDMSPQDVVDAINEAYDNKQQDGTLYVGYLKDGIQIDMYLDENGKIVTAYPVYEGD